MTSEAIIHFPPFRLDCATEQLWQGTQQIPLRPKPFAVLRYLAQHPNRLVTKEELLKAVWPETCVSEGLVHTYIRDLRQALRDDPEAPRFIETVARRGYRLIAPLTAAQPVRSAESGVRSLQSPTPNTQHPAPTLVGREPELAQLHQWLDKALQGERQVVFVTGEPGIGKTTLVDAFLQSLESRVQRLASKDQTPQPHTVQTLDPRRQTLDTSLWLGRGQCIEQYGPGEAYLPVLEALGRVGRAPGGEHLVAVLRRHAPTWLVQMPALVSETELESLQRTVQGTTRERMLRELVEALEVLTAQRLLVLWLEDLQWSDYSTLDLLAAVAQRHEAARLLVLGTYRPADVILSGHPLKGVKQELRTHRQCVELPLGFLSEAAVAQYLALRFPAHRFPAALPRWLRQSTEGNPLFLVNVVEYWIAQGVLAEVDGRWQLTASGKALVAGVPESLRQMIERQVERLGADEQRLLKAASVVGAEFAATVVAAELEGPAEQIEERCKELARQGHFLRASGMETWPDGTLSGRYGFLHALYQTVLYESVPAPQRLRLHRRIGERQEAAYGARAGEIAAELALHFERGQDSCRAVQYHGQAAENATRRHAPQEAIHHVRAALALLQTLPDTCERAEQELRLQLALAAPLIATTGLAAPEVGTTFTRARALCEQLGESPQLFAVLAAMWSFQTIRGELELARSQGEHLFHLAQRDHDSTHLLQAHVALGTPSMFLGSLASAYEHFTQGSLLYDPQHHHALVAVYGLDPGVHCHSFAAFSLFCLGYPDEARHRSEEALALARSLKHPYTTAQALTWAAEVHHGRREAEAAQEYAEALVTLAQEHEFPYWLGFGLLLRGWAVAMQGKEAVGCEQIRQGLTALQTTGAVVGLRFGATLLAEAYGKSREIEEGLAIVTEALRTLDQPGERLWDAELYRLKGELLLNAERGMMNDEFKKTLSSVDVHRSSFIVHRSAEAEAEACFLTAIEIARKQQAKSLELRAAISLARLWHGQGKQAEARQLLAEVYGWFTEGFETTDLQAAKALLDTLS